VKLDKCKLNYKIVAIVALVFVVSIYMVPSGQAVITKTYTHEDFSIDYPSGWEVIEMNERITFGSVFSAGSGAAIDIISMGKKDWDYDSSVTEKVNEFKSIISDYKQISFSKIDHPDQGEIWIHECSQTMLGEPEKVTQAFFKSNDLMIVLTCVSDEGQYGFDKQLYYDPMIQSMDVNGDGPNSGDDEGDNMIMWIIIISASTFVLLIIIVILITVFGKKKKDKSQNPEGDQSGDRVPDVNLINKRKGIEFRYRAGMMTYEQYMSDMENLK
jgi:hypothetical protein